MTATDLEAERIRARARSELQLRLGSRLLGMLFAAWVIWNMAQAWTPQHSAEFGAMWAAALAWVGRLLAGVAAIALIIAGLVVAFQWGRDRADATNWRTGRQLPPQIIDAAPTPAAAPEAPASLHAGDDGNYYHVAHARTYEMECAVRDLWRREGMLGRDATAASLRARGIAVDNNVLKVVCRNLRETMQLASHLPRRAGTSETAQTPQTADRQTVQTVQTE